MTEKEYQANYHQLNKERQRPARRRNAAKQRFLARDYITAYLASHPCVDCGNKDIRVLEFDHVRGKKTRCVTAIQSFRGIDLEVEKCDVRCANCHRKRHSHLTDSRAATYNTL